MQDPTRWVRQVPPDQRHLGYLTAFTVTRAVGGNLGAGRRPYIWFENVRYQSTALAGATGLIGQAITITVHPQDLRTVAAALPNGTAVGTLTAQPPWNRTPHTLETRRAIYRLKTRKMLHWDEAEDPIVVYLRYLATQAPTRKRARNTWARTAATVGEGAAPVRTGGGGEAVPVGLPRNQRLQALIY